LLSGEPFDENDLLTCISSSLNGSARETLLMTVARQAAQLFAGRSRLRQGKLKDGALRRVWCGPDASAMRFDD
jgi:hypothetical protein